MNQSAMHNTKGCNAKVDACAARSATPLHARGRRQALVGIEDFGVNQTSRTIAPTAVLIYEAITDTIVQIVSDCETTL
jgi:uncharacterized membrane protein